jgi:hypothetical protein
MAVVPADTPFTVAEAPANDKVTLLLLASHAPPEGDDVKAAEEPVHNSAGPLIAVGNALTTIACERTQPSGVV